MAIAGVAWGCYSMRSGTHDPAQTTAANFLRSVPMALIVMLLFARDASVDRDGFILAVASGAFSSGLGYLIWYAALREITTMTASVVQLSVPAIASLLGVILLEERMSDRLTIALVLTLLVIGLTLRRKSPRLLAGNLR